MTIKTRKFKNELCAMFALFLDAYGIRYENEGKWFKLRGYSYGRKNPGKPCPNGSVVACVEPDKGKWLRGSGILYVSELKQWIVGNYYGLDGDDLTAHFCDGRRDWDDRCFTLHTDDIESICESDKARAYMALDMVRDATTIPLPVTVKGSRGPVAAGALVSGDNRYLWVDDENPWSEVILMTGLLNNQ